jgi:nucleotide-binding universal stress UspA family protein
MMTVDRILCPVDFSAGSRGALHYALAVARWTGAATTVLHVHPLTQPVAGFGPYAEPLMPVGLSAEHAQTLLAELEAYVRLERATGADVTCLVEEDVNVSAGILTCAARTDAQLIVVGTHGYSGLDHLLLGSVTEKVLRRAACPVLTVPPGADGHIHAAGAVRTVLCPVDFSPISAQAIAWAAGWAQKARARLIVLHVSEISPDAGDPPLPEFLAYRDRLGADASQALHESVPAAIRSVVDVDEQLVVGRPYKEILRVAHECQADLIVMGVSGRGAVGRLFFGATVQHVIRRAECPVLTVRASAAAHR